MALCLTMNRLHPIRTHYSHILIRYFRLACFHQSSGLSEVAVYILAESNSRHLYRPTPKRECSRRKLCRGPRKEINSRRRTATLLEDGAVEERTSFGRPVPENMELSKDVTTPSTAIDRMAA